MCIYIPSCFYIDYKMKIHSTLISSFFIFHFSLFALNALAQERTVELTDPNESCTSIAVGKKVTTDGSVITSATCDGVSRTWMEFIPAQDWADTAKVEIYYDIRHTDSKLDRLGVVLKGTIPQAQHTNAYLSNGYPCMNEKQVAMGETTIMGRRELVNPKGMFHIEDVQALGLQRASTAREAIKVMGELAEKYGYGDIGECLTVADKNEIWFFEIYGTGKDGDDDGIGAMWVAQRIPDDHVTVSANSARISTVDFDDNENFMTSTNLREKTQKLGLWDGKEEFKFWKVMNGDRHKPYTIRDFFVLSSFAPSLNLTMDMDELPLSVKPDKNISFADVTKMLRETYEGTEYDMTADWIVNEKKRHRDGTEVDTTYKSPLAQNWLTRDMMNLINSQRPADNKMKNWRTISVVWCAYSFVAQLRDWLPDPVGGVCWWSNDNPGQSPRVPLFAGQTDVPESFKISGHKSYVPNSALWIYRRANRLAQVSWGYGRTLIEPAVLSYEQKGADEMPMVEQKVTSLINEGKEEEAKQYLTQYSFDFINSTLQTWQEIEAKLWHKFGRGF